MHVQDAPVSNSQLVVLSLTRTFKRGLSCTPLKGFSMSQILFTVAIDMAQSDKISCGITDGALVRGFTKLETENPSGRC